MAKEHPAKDRSQEPVEPADAHVDFNLEREPLQTGRRAPRVGVHARFLSSVKGWYLRRRIAWKLAIWFILLLLVVGGVVYWLVWTSPWEHRLN